MRGLSSVVATVLIISLTVITGAVLAAFVIPFVRDTLTGSTSCVAVQDQYSFDTRLGHTCYQPAHTTFSVAEHVDAKGAEHIVGFNIVLQNEEGTGVLHEARATSTTLQGLKDSAYPGLPGSGNVKTYRVDGRYIVAHLYAVLDSGKTCAQQKGTVTLRQC